MIKVKFVRELGVGVAGAAALVSTGASVGGCAVKAGHVGTSNAAATTASPSSAANPDPTAAGSGTLALSDYEMTYQSSSGGDEFIRTGESLTLTINWSDAYWALCNGNCSDPNKIDPVRFTGSASIQFLAGDGSVASTAQVAIHWDSSGVGTSDPFVVPPSVPHFNVSFQLTDSYNGNSATLSSGQIGHAQFAVFGAYLPNKEILFDNDANGNSRQRVIEGGALVAGANVTLSFTDWRGDRTVNRDSLNLTIGQGTTESRFGVQTVDVQGQLSYNIAATYSTDGGQTWTTVNLPAVNAPDDLDNPTPDGRTAYQATFQLPNGASDFKVAFHVQAILTASPQYSQYVNTWYQSPNGSTYQLGQQYVLVDTWDNDAMANGNYDFPVATAD